MLSITLYGTCEPCMFMRYWYYYLNFQNIIYNGTYVDPGSVYTIVWITGHWSTNDTSELLGTQLNLTKSRYGCSLLV